MNAPTIMQFLTTSPEAIRIGDVALWQWSDDHFWRLPLTVPGCGWEEMAHDPMSQIKADLAGGEATSEPRSAMMLVV